MKKEKVANRQRTLDGKSRQQQHTRTRQNIREEEKKTVTSNYDTDIRIKRIMKVESETKTAYIHIESILPSMTKQNTLTAILYWHTSSSLDCHREVNEGEE